MEKANALPPHMQSCHSEQSEIHFTPVKTSNAPRVWDRKPSTSFLARSKPRKVWKRFRSSFNSMKALHQLIAPDVSGLTEKELLHEINTRQTAEYSRGVKRQCLAMQPRAAENEGVESSSGRGRSFLETKWETEVLRKRRKLPATADNLDQHMIVDDPQDGEDDEMAGVGDAPGGTTSNRDTTMQDLEKTGESPTLTPALSDTEAAYPDVLPGEAGRLLNEPRGVIVDIKSLDHVSQEKVRCLKTQDAADGAAATDDALGVAAVADGKSQPDVPTITTSAESVDTMAVPVEPVELTAEQESTLVRSALRSSLDGDDTALLNNFLSKAKAKREAKAAAEAEAATVIAADPEDRIEKEQEAEPVSPPKQQVFVEIPTPERRALEALDANTSSPQRSPSKPEKDDDGSASPVARRSTRVRGLQRAAAPTGFRTTLSLRRARGNEFVFLQRTEAQEIALQTRRNTKQNKGDATLPKFTLQGLTRQTPDSGPTAVESSRKPSNKPKKNVSWNDSRLVEFEGESSDDELAQPATTTAKPTAPAKPAEKKRAASSRASHSISSLKTGGPGEKAAAAAAAAPAATAASPAPRARRVRRLGPPKPLEPTAFDSNDGASSSSPPSPTMASPIVKRKKLTPKSPKTSFIKTPSKVPTPVAKETEIPSLLSGGRSVKANLLKVNAGSTPMARRVRRA
ncbi:uncharacterized protein BDV17DRAFT_255088 [Aspergillus undulatus]|uniref:uncharacterized protein n=1 Tax=Aspergillus undulatus TaxID=1810928 RepID=UPI003CCDBE68